MPYRRLPNTDASRMKALRTALKKGKNLPPFKLAFSQQCLHTLQAFLPSFEQAINLQKQSYQQQIQKSSNYKDSINKARIYISHFIQVVNLAITRGELNPSVRKYYELDPKDTTVPSLKTETEILKTGKKLIEGEKERIKQGHTAVTNPTIALVNVRYEQFIDAYNFQKTLQKRSKLQQEKLLELRSEANNIILKIWNEVEDHFTDLPEEMKRERAMGYGLVYVYRKNEQQRIHFLNLTREEVG